MDSTKGVGRPNDNSPSVKKGNNYLLAIAIDQYEKSPLSNCVKDAQDILTELTTRYAFKKEHITSIFNAEATRSNILNAFRDLKDKVTLDDNVLIYFSGHGFTEDNLGFWIPVNADIRDEADWVSVSDIRDRLSRIKSLHTDACFAGSLFVKGSKGDLETTKSGTLSSRLGITSSHSRERAYDGKAGENSPFAICFLEALKQNQGSMATSSLYSEIKGRVERRTGNRQTPLFRPLDVEGDDLGEFYFHVKSNEKDDWQAALLLNTTDGFQKFKTKYPLSIHTAEADYFIQKIEKEAIEKAKTEAEKRAYTHARQVKTVASLAKFLRGFPLSIHVEEIEKMLGKVEEEADWKEAKNRDNLSAYLSFKKKYPSSHFIDECQKRIDAEYDKIDAKEKADDERWNRQKTLRQQIENANLKAELKKQQEAAENAEREKVKQEQDDYEKQRTEKILSEVDETVKTQTEWKANFKRYIENEQNKTDEYIVYCNPLQIDKVVPKSTEFRKSNSNLINLKGTIYQLSKYFDKIREYIFSHKFDKLVYLLALLTIVFMILKKDISFNIKTDTPLKLESTESDITLRSDFEHEMVFVQGGTFTMGCTIEQGNDCQDNEKPAHSVTLSSFYIGKYEVTQAQWKAVMGNNPSNFKCDECPVEQVSWDDCQAFLKKLNEITGKKYRLPTEAEWEFAARGGTESIGYTYSGSNSLEQVAWYEKNSNSKTHAVGGKQANELGIYDMSGNVWEWCSDWYDENYYKNSPIQNPKGATKGEYRLLRGGSWGVKNDICHVSFRSHLGPYSQFYRIGFRVVCVSQDK